MQSIIEQLENVVEKMALETLTYNRLTSIVHRSIAVALAERAWETYTQYCQH